MPHLVLCATAWGPRHGGINAFNFDLATALGALLARYQPDLQVVVLVARGTEAAQRDAAQRGLQLVSLELDKEESLCAAQTERARDRLCASVSNCAIIWCVGHDVSSGELAVELAKQLDARSAVVQHMSYRDYMGFKHISATVAEEKHTRQEQLFRSAHKALAVGPLLRDRLSDMLGDRLPLGCKPAMLVPGLADISVRNQPSSQFVAITFGRLDPENDRIKQGRLTVAGFAEAVKKAYEDGPRCLEEAVLYVIGLDHAEVEGHELMQLANSQAGRVIVVQGLPYTEDRIALGAKLASARVALMPSWHEGFGLTGWEAIAAEVPLIVSKRSGLYMLLEEALAGAGTGCVRAIDVRGQLGSDTYRPEDVDEIAKAIRGLARDPEPARRSAHMLHRLLNEHCGFSWEKTARDFLRALDLPVEERPLPPPVPTARSIVSDVELIRIPTPQWQPGLPLSTLLQADETAVPFHSVREPLLAEILTWALDTKHAISLQLRIGPAGSGKTRLLLEACTQLRGKGIYAGFLRAEDHNKLKNNLPSLIAKHERLFFVLDYAETRRKALAELISAAASHLSANTSSRQLRILLLARNGGDWWRRLADDFQEQAHFFNSSAVSGPYEMPPLRIEDSERHHVFFEALEALAKKLGIDVLPKVVPDLAAPYFGEMLFIHSRALIALHGQHEESAPALLDALLRHEHRYWRDLPLAPTAIEQLLALITLHGEATASSHVRRLIDLAPLTKKAKPAAKESLRRRLSDLYPNEGGVAALRPDLLGERLVARSLAGDDSPLDLLLGVGVPSSIAAHALTVLSRLARRWPEEARWLERGLARHLISRATLAAQLALTVGDPLGVCLAQVIDRASPVEQQEVAQTLKSLPIHTVALREVACTIARLRSERKDPSHEPDDKRRWVEVRTEYARRLADIGKPDASVDLLRQVAPVAESLAQRGRSTDQNAWAVVQNNLAVGLARLGQLEEAAQILQQVVDETRRLTIEETRYRGDLALALSNYSGRLLDMGRPKEAYNCAHEALQIRREHVMPSVVATLFDIAKTLHSSVACLQALGEYKVSCEHAEEACHLLETLMTKHADAAQPDLAEALYRLAISMVALGRYREALIPAGEAHRLNHEMATRRPDAFLENALRTRSGLAYVHLRCGQPERARALLATELLLLDQAFPNERGSATREALIFFLTNLAQAHLGCGDPAAAWPLSERAVAAAEGLSLPRERPARIWAYAVRSQVAAAQGHLPAVAQDAQTALVLLDEEKRQRPLPADLVELLSSLQVPI